MNKERKGERDTAEDNSDRLRRIMEHQARNFASMDKGQLEKRARSLFAENYNLNAEKKKLLERISELESKLRVVQLTGKNEHMNSSVAILPTILLIKQIIRDSNRVMTTKQIGERLVQLKPELSQRWEDVRKRVSDLLSRLTTTGEVRRYRSNGSTGYYYGAPEWFDGNGKVNYQFGP